MQTQIVTLNSESFPTHGYLICVNRKDTPIIELGDFVTIGREPTNTVVLTDPFVSARHARIERRKDRFHARDLQSRNGIAINSARVLEAFLQLNDRVQIGETEFVFAASRIETRALSSKNATWNAQLERLPAFAKTPFPILITGPSGSGKEILARKVHELSARKSSAFVSINCSALSESLIESELFGHVRGSFTGASHDRKGAFEAARKGTLFLDEIGDLPLALQPKLLRALENGEIRPLGSDKTIETDVRVVAATHKNLVHAVHEGRFREDLYYRLNVCQITPPALGERLEDFEDLIYSFAKQYRVRFSFSAIAVLKQHSWPGNIRELKNLVARASAYFPGHHIQADDLKAIMKNLSLPAAEVHYLAESALSARGSVIREIEREMIVRRLIANNGNQRRTAIDLGLPKSTLHDRIRSYSIDIGELMASTPNYQIKSDARDPS
jgi:DNA-binding NtrC family response regulator